jgi:hypothetical protein
MRKKTVSSCSGKKRAGKTVARCDEKASLLQEKTPAGENDRRDVCNKKNKALRAPRFSAEKNCRLSHVLLRTSSMCTLEPKPRCNFLL